VCAVQARLPTRSLRHPTHRCTAAGTFDHAAAGPRNRRMSILGAWALAASVDAAFAAGARMRTGRGTETFRKVDRVVGHRRCRTRQPRPGRPVSGRGGGGLPRRRSPRQWCERTLDISRQAGSPVRREPGGRRPPGDEIGRSFEPPTSSTPRPQRGRPRPGTSPLPGPAARVATARGVAAALAGTRVRGARAGRRAPLCQRGTSRLVSRWARRPRPEPRSPARPPSPC
jgi:hypothetical protein